MRRPPRHFPRTIHARVKAIHRKASGFYYPRTLGILHRSDRNVDRIDITRSGDIRWL